MSKKLAIIFPGIKYSVDKPLLYYSKRILEKNDYEVVGVSYTGMKDEPLFELIDGEYSVSKEKLLSFVSKAKEIAKKQLERIDFSKYEKVIFVSKSVGTVIGAIYAKQAGISPYHILITPLDYTFQFMEDCDGSVFCGTEDALVKYAVIKKICKEQGLAYHSFKGCNHSLETGDVEMDLEHMNRYVSVVKEIVADLDKSIYNFEVEGRNHQQISMSQYKGKVLLIVNTATGCGFTPQYQMLEDLYRKYRNHGLEILDFPCNQFANQAPGTASEIYSFCTSRYDITFEQFAKVNVNGEKQIELYEYLKSRKGFKGFDMSKLDSNYIIRKLEQEAPDYETSSDIKWNFTKFLVNRKGQVIERFETTTDFHLIEQAILQLL